MLSAGFLSLADLKDALLPAKQPDRDDYDDKLVKLGLGVARSFEQHCNRKFVRAEGTVYETDAARSSVTLEALPVEAITSVELLCYGESTAITTDVAALLKSPGIVRFGSVLGSHLDTVRVTYTGGYWLDDGNAMPAGATPLPEDLLEAYIEQCQAEAEARDLFRNVGMQKPGENAKPGMLPRVKEVLKQYVRFNG